MKLRRFSELAGRMWEEIPPQTREGVDALAIEERAVPHPDFGDVFTLGECITDSWPSGFGEGEMRSELVLYHGSFRELAERDPAFDWEGELWETILHELLHHREAAAGESGLDDFDWAEEQNRRRLAGWSFDPAFYRFVPTGADGVVRLDSEMFLEVEVPADADEAVFAWRGRSYSIRVPRGVRRGFFQVANLAAGRLWVVVRRRRKRWRPWGGVGGREPLELSRIALPRPAATEA